MTPTIMTKEDFRGLGAPDLVYVREIRAADVLAETPLPEATGLAIDPEARLYAVHGADGERLAVMMDRETAFAAAVAHELEPVSVH
ncbi:DUF1150 family protein [Brevundimonas sp.]|uniref:DUF1150 family protein n=1 Tax=Brevundimonas sp. TaxID=1871086 RepID=UPI002D32A5FC|nr:DUF1150 family protein [Brevundimonas sp.]HYD26691.1 DUF1150 family protein [Brevundimonas sp.]